MFLFLGTISLAQWVQTTLPGFNGTSHALLVSGTNLFAGTDSGGVFLSTNNGTSWTAVNTGIDLTDRYVWAMIATSYNVLVGTSGATYVSTNNGANWTSTSGSGGVSAFAMSVSNLVSTNVFAGTGGGVFLSTNNGTSWTAVNTGLTNSIVRSLAVSATNLFAGTPGTYGGGVFLSTNNGTSWTLVNTGLPNINGELIASLAVSGTDLFAGTYGRGVFLSTNNGASWSAASTGLPINSIIQCLAVSGTNLFAGTGGIDRGGIFISTNNGTSWTSVNTELPIDKDVLSLAVSGMDLFAGTGGNGVWRRPLSEMITGVINKNKQTLSQASKSFNLTASTKSNHIVTICFTLLQPQPVALKIYNLSGREISTLVNRNLGAGDQRISWDTKNVAVGCYAVRMQVGSNVYVKNVPVSR